MTVVMDIKTINPKDRELLAILSENAREQTAAIARRLGLSRTTVQAKIERLEREGIIEGYGVKLSAAYESGMVKAHVLITIAPKTLARVTAELHGISAVRTLHSVSGSFDLIAVVAAASIAELDHLIDRIGEIEGVERTLSSIILSTRIRR
ncbi:Lrp/AsnC family transcriptional regulator [Shinella daejeonensis]|uniref:Lrp/AsnC family transcriptional regulator n=1 Tax=Shinella daejeonensis TaxID=659017 RepID=UPI0020C814F8|nr:Lrp/AsnC family transcriptional regulator [Shinella daejeonensis]MCP8896002.1 Lrp/AsnC family transcriptional regulator [Shinella daejeonensis]